jgi:lantibiotic modifying enzyme
MQTSFQSNIPLTDKSAESLSPSLGENRMEMCERIAKQLVLFSSFISNIGLYHGKMGIVLSLFHYARFTGKKLYEDFAGELLNEVCEEMPQGMSIDFEDGLCGIGWGIEYLLQNHFAKGDSNAILASIDQKIMERDIRRMMDKSFPTGLGGISCYISKRLHSPFRRAGDMPFEETYLNDWKTIAESIHFSDDKQVLRMITQIIPEGDNISSWNLGLSGGCAGFILKNILTL